jgi:hypothetical protein
MQGTAVSHSKSVVRYLQENAGYCTLLLQQCLSIAAEKCRELQPLSPREQLRICRKMQASAAFNTKSIFIIMTVGKWYPTR